MGNQNSAQPVQEVPNQTPVEQPVVEPEKTSFLSSKWLKIGLVFVVLLLIAGSAYFLGKNANKKTTSVSPSVIMKITPTPNPTAGWKTYVGNRYSIKYPSYLKLALNSGGFEFPGGTKTNPFVGEITTGVSNAPSGNEIPTLGEGFTKDSTIIDGIKAQGNEVSAVFPAYETYVIYQGKLYTVRLEGNISSGSEQRRVYNQMLSTFKFTNSKAQSNLTTYASALEPNLSFQYPSSWKISKQVGTDVIGKFEKLTMTTPNGTSVAFGVGGNNIGGACSDTAINTINQVTPLPYAQGLYLMDVTYDQKSGAGETIGVSSSSHSLGKVNGCSTPELIFYSKSDRNRQIILSSDNKSSIDKSDVANVLRSLKY